MLCSHVSTIVWTENSCELVHMYTDHIDCAVMQVVSHWLLTKGIWFNPRAVHV